MIVLDASVAIAHLSPEDAQHDLASNLLCSVAGEDLVMHPLHLAEVLVGGVRAGRGRELLVDLEDMGVACAWPAGETPGAAALRLAELRVRLGLKLPDCCALDAALSTGSTLATLDRELADVARSLHLAAVP